jgi:hypothetical protein
MKLKILLKLLQGKAFLCLLKDKIWIIAQKIIQKIAKKFIIQKREKKEVVKKKTRKRKKKISKILSKILKNYSVLLSFVFIIVVISISTGVIFSYLYYSIVDKINSEKETMIFSAKMDLAKKEGNFHLIKKEIMSIEKKFLEKRKDKWGIKYNKHTRLTDVDFTDTAAHLYFYAIRWNVDWLAYMANRTTESEWNKHTRSRVGAIGVDQLMPETFRHMNRALGKFGNINITSVYHNTEAGLHNWMLSRNYLRKELKRDPTIREISMAYNMGEYGFIRSYRNGNKKRNYPFETWRHGFKVEWYYNNYKKGNYYVVWEEHLLKKLEKKYL